MPNDAFFQEINRLLRFLTEEAAGYAFASAEDQRLVALINQELIRRATEKGKASAILFLDGDSDTPIPAQLRASADAPTSSLIVPNLDAIVMSLGSAVVHTLNFSREALYQLRKPVLFWASKATLHQLANEAADFYSQRVSNTVFFEGHLPEPAGMDLFESISPDRLADADIEGLRLKIGLLKTQLQDAEKLGYPLTRIASDLALPLAEAYAAMGRVAKIPPLREKYWSFLPQNVATLIRLGNLWFKEGEIEKALEAVQKAQELAKVTADESR